MICSNTFWIQYVRLCFTIWYDIMQHDTPIVLWQKCKEKELLCSTAKEIFLSREIDRLFPNISTSKCNSLEVFPLPGIPTARDQGQLQYSATAGSPLYLTALLGGLSQTDSTFLWDLLLSWDAHVWSQPDLQTRCVAARDPGHGSHWSRPMEWHPAPPQTCLITTDLVASLYLCRGATYLTLVNITRPDPDPDSLWAQLDPMDSWSHLVCQAC